MRIDFFHVDLLPKSSIRSISETYSNNGIETDFNSHKQFKKYKKEKFNNGKYYNEILKELQKESHDSNESVYDKDFISKDDLSRLKHSIENDTYNINNRVLLISIMKYAERI